MRNSILVSVVAVAACSSSPKPPPEEPKPPEPVVDTKPEAPPEIAESELCAKLDERARSSKDMDSTQAEKIMPIVDKHCPSWPESVRRCLATGPEDKMNDCLAELDPALRDAFVRDVMAVMTPPPSCDEMTASAVLFAPVPTGVQGDDATAVNRANGAAIVASCRENSWSDDVRRCVADAVSDPRICLTAEGVDPSVSTKLDADLKRRGDLFAAAIAFKPTDKKIGCDKAAAAHYGAGQWKTKMADAKKKDKDKAIKQATKDFTKACKDESWSAFVRGCVVAAKSEEERGWCIDATKWGYPPGSEAVQPISMTKSTGMPECDDYVAAVKRYGACDKLPAEARDAVAQSVTELEASWDPAMSDDAKHAAASGCKAGVDALRDAAKSLGCAI